MTDVDEATDTSGGRRRRRKEQRAGKKPMPLWLESVVLLGIALALAVLIKALFLQAFYIPSPSMEPQFVEDDRILVQKVSYWGSGEPQRGDIIVFKDPGGWLDPVDTAGATGPVSGVLERIGLYPTGGHLVKRVMAVGGDHIVCCDDDGRITVNGDPLDESAYLPPGTDPSDVTFDKTVPDGYLWMMGDNRAFSFDSRGHMGGPGGGFVKEDLVVGKVFALVWPWGRAELIDRPEVFDGVPDPQGGSQEGSG
ncbi:signal peptidase I [Nocardioides aequoreus]|uniref:signal peptidase I n=1 Tax=Nocardioides aequoreus TaxID=397278 RepID=UPI000ABDF8AF|nr:signal peptidase I [Nocardioides aequoreus]